MEGITRLQLPTPPPYIYMLSMILQQLKNYPKIRQCHNQLSDRIIYKTIAIEVVYLFIHSYAVNLVWLHCCTREPQWFQYLLLVFLEIQNVPLRTVFANPVTYNISLSYIRM